MLITSEVAALSSCHRGMCSQLMTVYSQCVCLIDRISISAFLITHWKVLISVRSLHTLSRNAVQLRMTTPADWGLMQSFIVFTC